MKIEEYALSQFNAAKEDLIRARNNFISTRKALRAFAPSLYAQTVGIEKLCRLKPGNRKIYNQRRREILRGLVSKYWNKKLSIDTNFSRIETEGRKLDLWSKSTTGIFSIRTEAERQGLTHYSLAKKFWVHGIEEEVR